MTTATNFQPGDKSRTRASLKRQLLAVFTDASCLDANSELTLTVPADRSHDILLRLRDDFDFSQCMDVTAVDYSGWYQSDWQTTPNTAFSRARGALQSSQQTTHPCRFAVVYHLLSLRSNDRLRVKVYLPDDTPLAVASVVDIWSGVAWFEREVYDMFGIAFTGHPDLRRILTDYGFVGHPLRKDFPLIGEVEVRYDADQQRVIYQPVTITPRVNVPRVVRHDSRYARVQIDGDGPQHG